MLTYEVLHDTRYPRHPSDAHLATAMQAGFDGSKLWFHGTRKRFDGFQLPKQRGIDELGPGVYLTSEKWLANTWARKGGFIVICVVRKGPLFDMAKLNSPESMTILRQGYIRAAAADWFGDGYDEAKVSELFDWEWKQNPARHARIIASSLSAAGYIGGFKHESQIAGQIVVFKPEDVKIVGRQGGQAWMTD